MVWMDVIYDGISDKCPGETGGRQVQVGLQPGQLDRFVSCQDVKEVDATLTFGGIEAA